MRKIVAERKGMGGDGNPVVDAMACGPTGACFAEGMTSFLRSRGIRIFVYPQFALPLRERIRENARALAAKHVPVLARV